MTSEKLNFNVSVYTSDMEFAPSFDEVRILYAVDGHCTLVINDTTTDLRKWDYYLINVFEAAAVRVIPGSYLAVVSIPYDDLLKGADRSFVRFRMNSREGADSRYQEMRFQLRGLIMCFMGDLKSSRFQAIGLYYLVLQGLISNFRVDEAEEADRASSDDLTSDMLQYILKNYRSEITIGDLAERFFLSRSSASRMLKAYTGENFPDMLKKLRLTHVREELEQTDLSVTDIALNAGFSSLSVLNRTFKETFGVTPTEYRTGLGREETEETDRQSEMDQVYHLLEQTDEGEFTEDYEAEILEADVKDRKPFVFWKNRMLNVGPFSSMLSAKMQEQVLFIQDRLHVQTLRMWNPFSSNMLLYNREEQSFNYAFLDEILDFCVDHGLKVCMDMTPRRERILANPGREIVGVPGETVFTSLREWIEAFRMLLTHLVNRYREDQLSGWIFEISFFMNEVPYYRSDDYDPRKLWDEACSSIRSIIPDARIAGPGLIPGDSPQADLDRIEMFLRSQTFLPDIFTSVHFPYTSSFRNLYSGSYTRNASRFYFRQETERIRRKLDQMKFAGEFWVMEHGITIANRNYLQDSCYRGAEIIDSMLTGARNADAVGIFYASDLLGAYSDSGSPLLGNGGILTYQGIRKPVFFAYRFLHHLGSSLILETEHCLVTANNERDIRILCWNKKRLGPKYYMTEENTFSPQELDGLFENLGEYSLELQLKGLEEGRKMRIRQQVVNREHGSVLDKWISLGSLKEMNRDDLEYLHQTSVPEITIREIVTDSEPLKISARLQPNEMRLIRITAV